MRAPNQTGPLRNLSQPRPQCRAKVPTSPSPPYRTTTRSAGSREGSAPRHTDHRASFEPCAGRRSATCLCERQPQQADIKTRFARRLRRLRLERGWTQVQMAVELDMHLGHNCELERGQETVSLRTIEVSAMGLKWTCLNFCRTFKGPGHETCAPFRLRRCGPSPRFHS